MKALRRVLPLAGPARFWLVLAVLTCFGALAANIALMTAAPYLISRAALVTGFAEVAVLVTAVRTFAIARAALRYAERYTTHLAALRTLTHLRAWLYRAIEPLSPGGLPWLRTGDLLARVVADLDTLDAFFVRGIVPPVAAVLAGGAGCAVLGVLDLRLALVLLAFLVAAGLVLPLLSRRRSRRPAAQLVRARAELHATLADQITGLADLMAYGREDEVRAQLRFRSEAVGREQQRLAAVRGGSTGLAALLAGLAGLVLLVLAIQLVRVGRIDGVFCAVVPLVGLAAFEGMQSLGDAFRQAEESRPAADRTFEVVDARPAVAEPLRPRALPAHPEIELRRVRFRYAPGDDLALDGVSLRLPPGGRVGIVGPSGAGKTTVVSLLLRFWEADPGMVLVGGHDIRRCRAEDVRARIGLVPQRIMLFDSTLRDNLLVADGDAADRRLLEECERAGLADFVSRLPRGLDTRVGEDGVKLSGGQRQQIALARVFLKAAPVLILDEATANLDADTEREVLRGIDAFAQERSLLVISHRSPPLGLVHECVELPAPAGRGVRRGPSGEHDGHPL
ncbi:MAG: thiol reductant ABC exporter subunit CydC [bacterium]|jgi:ATP-binding cassette subfamily C protein CydC|nr:thiol reductant ABC exporter subunit CydC [bacterium]